MLLTSLPKETLIKILPYVGTPNEISKTALICNDFCNAVNEESLWKELAMNRFGEHITYSTKHLYPTTTKNNNSYKLMMIDDNRRGALPTLHGIWKCNWKNNTRERFYCCLIPCIKWDRSSNQVLIYIDARGMFDLRQPDTSGIWLRDIKTGKVTLLDDNRIHPNRDGSYNLGNFFGIPRMISRYEFVNLSPTEQTQNAINEQQQHNNNNNGGGHGAGRYKGVLKVDANLFSQQGSYQFCYANSTPTIYSDYEECTLFTITKENNNGLLHVFDTFSLHEETPFNSNEFDVEQWKHHDWYSQQLNVVPKNYLGPWLECVGMTGKEAKEYIESQSFDLFICIVPYGDDNNVPNNYCPSRVRLFIDSNGKVRDPPRRA